MIYRIHHGLLDGRQREIPKAFGFGAVRVLDHHLGQVIAPDVVHRIAGDAPQRAAKLLLLKAVATRPIREIHYVDLRGREEALRVLVEKQQAHILGKRPLRRPTDHAHAPSQGFHVQRLGLCRQITAHFLQELAHQIR